MDEYTLARTTTDPVILDELSKDKNWIVRVWVALNLNTSPETLNELSKDKDFYVRCGVADSPNTSPETLNELSKDENPSVRCRVADSPNTSPETLKQMAIVEEDDITKFYIKTNRNCPEETWRYLSALEILETLPQVST